MANINKQITLTSKGANAGPLFDIFYSLDCINYTICIDGNDVSLPAVGSTVIVTVPEEAICIKVVNQNTQCEENFVIDSFGTTTTTTAGTTTTTTTCAPCYRYNIYRTSNPASVDYIDCYGEPRNDTWSSIVERTICAREITYLSNAGYTFQGNCSGLPCDGGASLNNCDCENTTVTINGVQTRWIYWKDCQTGASDAVLLSYFSPTSNTDCRVTGSLILPDPSSFTIVKNSDCDCTTTTTTTTAAPTTTTTTSGGTTTTTTTFSPNPCNCVEVNITSEGGEVATFNCYGQNQNYVYANAGTYNLCAAVIGGLLQVEIVSGTGTYSPVGNCKTQTCPPPTTTTTTIPYYYKVELCGGGDGPYVVSLASGDTPSGIGQAFKLSGGGYPGFNGVNCWEVLENPTSDPIDFIGVNFGSVYSNCNDCNVTTTTTAAPTTTTTVAPTTTTTTIACYNCGDGYEYYTTSSNNYQLYPDKQICATSNQCFSLAWDSVDRPNRFTVYDSSGLIWTSGWVGYATWAGPWGASLNTATSGNSGVQQFNSILGRYVRVEAGNGDPLNPSSDAANWAMSCQSCPTTTTTTTTAAPTSQWTASNYDCGFGTLNDVGINGSFMGSLSGPSTFPLTSTLYGYKSNPNGINYGSTNTIQANVTTNLPGTGNCAVLRVVVNGTTTYETYFTSNPYPQVSGVVINPGDQVWVYVQCYEGACPGTTTTTTSSPVYTYTGCGYGSSAASACNDAANDRTLYSDCDSGTFGVGCYVYVDTFPNPLTGYTNVFMNGASWDVNSSTGLVTAYSSEQC